MSGGLNIYTRKIDFNETSKTIFLFLLRFCAPLLTNCYCEYNGLERRALFKDQILDQILGTKLSGNILVKNITVGSERYKDQRTNIRSNVDDSWGIF